MARNKIQHLRDHLFETLEALKDTENPMELDRAKAIADVAQVIVNSAKIEVDLAKALGYAAPATGFLEVREIDARALPAGTFADQVRSKPNGRERAQ